ncbi:carbon monoxide dehydrogenase subunit G [Streptomyces sp. DSM 41527]|uniref:Carbon monoxide dehydrogenase subunit G n=1 Tax=Streptomyces mooreae TaxID=3075523 RepID=A0ABU2TEI9_9ACTN|nr:carbon monoxide dehydrogenase subunit G [Streptomyces sp. DSM 41527]MDT0459350.1 carbon monoxide dehydrogenase subunit G [Streptomyces sp. DSM 41527]
MEHEVYVPFPVGTVRQALTEPERVARCVPGVQLDADAAPRTPVGRLRLRIGSSTITYRGTLTVSAAAEDEGSGDGGPGDRGTGGDAAGDGGAAAVVTVEAKGTETRGDGAVALTLTVRLSPATEPGPGTTLACSGTVHGDGRLAEAADQSARTAGRRLLDRFAENLAADLRQRPVTGRTGDGPSAGGTAEAAEPGVFGTEVPPSSLEPGSDEGAGGEEDAGEAAGLGEAAGDVGDLDAGDAEDVFRAAHDGHPEHAYGHDPDGLAPAEAAHARRTMIGRSAEEVDHAPPRGRYAPVPAPEPHGTSVALRWAAPAAAVVLASAVVVGRVLRRRR